MEENTTSANIDRKEPKTSKKINRKMKTVQNVEGDQEKKEKKKGEKKRKATSAVGNDQKASAENQAVATAAKQTTETLNVGGSELHLSISALDKYRDVTPGTRNGTGRYTFSAGQNDVLCVFLPTYQKAKDKRKTAAAVFTVLKTHVPAFATPQGFTEQDWQNRVRKWFENHHHKQRATERAEPVPNEPVTPVVRERLPWSKLRYITKHLNSITQGLFKLKMGKDLFEEDANTQLEIARRGAINDIFRVVSELWDDLGEDEQEAWEKAAVDASPIQQNQQDFFSALQVLIQGCLRCGHLGNGKVAVVASFDNGYQSGGDIETSSFMESSFDEWTGDLSTVYGDYENLVHVIGDCLIDSLPQPDTNLEARDKIPLDPQGVARFPEVNADMLGVQSMKELYDDFIKVVWRQAGHRGAVRYDLIAASPSEFYDMNELPPDMTLDDPEKLGIHTHAFVAYFTKNCGIAGVPFTFYSVKQEVSKTKETMEVEKKAGGGEETAGGSEDVLEIEEGTGKTIEDEGSKVVEDGEQDEGSKVVEDGEQDGGSEDEGSEDEGSNSKGSNNDNDGSDSDSSDSSSSSDNEEVPEGNAVSMQVERNEGSVVNAPNVITTSTIDQAPVTAEGTRTEPSTPKNTLVSTPHHTHPLPFQPIIRHESQARFFTPTRQTSTPTRQTSTPTRQTSTPQLSPLRDGISPAKGASPHLQSPTKSIAKEKPAPVARRVYKKGVTPIVKTRRQRQLEVEQSKVPDPTPTKAPKKRKRVDVPEEVGVGRRTRQKRT